MRKVSVRELRNAGGRVLGRVVRGEVLTVTMDGHAVAELRPVAALGATAAELIRRRQLLPSVDPQRLRSDVDRVTDARL